MDCSVFLKEGEETNSPKQLFNVSDIETMTIVAEIRSRLHAVANPQKAAVLSKFFKTGKGQYGEGDCFWGLPVPTTRALIKPFGVVDYETIDELLHDPIHECRFAGAALLVEKYKRTKEEEGKREVVDFYVARLPLFNNWDLVDLSCYLILGDFLRKHDRSILYRLAESKNLWEQRVAIVSTMAFIRKEETEDTFRLAEQLMKHPHDLMHKAVGWLLREAGKKSPEELRQFLDRNIRSLSRTSLRYAIERFPEEERKEYLNK